MSFNEPTQNSHSHKGHSSQSTSPHLPLDVVIYNFMALLKRHKLVVLFPVLVAEAFALYSYFVLVTYTAKTSLIIQKAENSSLVALSIDLGANKSNFFNPSLSKDSYLETVLLYLKTRDSFEEAAKNILEKDSGKKLYSKLKTNLSESRGWLESAEDFFDAPKKPTKIDPIRDFGRMLKTVTRFDKASVPGFVISVTTSSSQLSIEIAKIMAEQAQTLITRRDLKQLEEGKNYIVSKLDEINDSLSSIDSEMLVIRQKSSGPITQKGNIDTFSSLREIRTDLEQNRIKLEQNQKLVTSILDNLKSQGKNLNKADLDSTAQAIIRRQLVALQARKRGLISEGMSESSPQVVALQEEIEKTEKQITRSPAFESQKFRDNSLAFLEDNTNPELRLSELKKENFLIKTRIAAAQKLLLAEKVSKEALPEAEQKYYALNKQLEMRYLLFGELSKQLFNIDVNRIAIQNRVLNIESASDSTITRKPSLFPLIPMAFILALIFGALVASIIENYDPTVVSAKDLPGFNYLSLGSVPLIKEANKTNGANKETSLKTLIFRHKLDLPETLPFKRLRTRLIHAQRGLSDQAKIISTHSNQSGDGKSFITGNLAASLAALNKKVLLIDCDLRKKALTRQLNPKNSLGLSNFLEDAKINDYTQFIIPNIQPCLDLLPSGPASNQSSELINSPKFTQLLDSARNQYDYIFIDDAPFLALPDSEIVASQSDIILIVASCYKTKVNDLSNMLDHFLQFGDKTVGVILNRSLAKNQMNYYYGITEENKPRSRAA